MSDDPGLFWKIVGYHSTKKMFETTLPAGALSEPEMIVLLQRLAATHLTPDEIVSASLRKSSRRYAALLEPQVDSRPPGRFSVTVGLNPHYVASIWRSDELKSEQSDA
jgi:hypothetical protein